MKTFREMVLTEVSTIEKIQIAFGDKLMPFLDELYFYIDENDSISRDFVATHKKELKKAGFLTSPKIVYRLVKLEKKELDKKPTKKTIYSTSTKKLDGKMLDLMKGMITTYKVKGDFYYIEIDDAEGLDINAFGKAIKANEKELMKINPKTISWFLETIKSKAAQEEFLIFGSYGVDKIVPA